MLMSVMAGGTLQLGTLKAIAKDPSSWTNILDYVPSNDCTSLIKTQAGDNTVQTLVAVHPAFVGIRPFFFDYLVYGSADPILEDFEKKKKIIYFLI